MVAELVFHLGDCKTGTTSIQTALVKNAVRGPHDIIYPARFNHVLLAKSLHLPSEMPTQGRRFAKVRQALNATDSGIGIISAEHFEFVPPHLLDQAIREHIPRYYDKSRFIIYVRPHIDRFLSTYIERNKKGIFVKPLDRFYIRAKDSGLLQYAARLQAWKDIFKDRLIIRPYLKNLFPNGDIVHDFFNFVFQGQPFDVSSNIRENSGLSLQNIALLRIFHDVFADSDVTLKHQRAALGWYLGHTLKTETTAIKHTPLMVPRALADKLYNTCHQDAAEIDRLFFDGSPFSGALCAARDNAPDIAPQSLDPKDHFTTETIAHIRATAGILRHIATSDPEHFMWAIRPDNQRDPYKYSLQNI